MTAVLLSPGGVGVMAIPHVLYDVKLPRLSATCVSSSVEPDARIPPDFDARTYTLMLFLSRPGDSLPDLHGRDLVFYQAW